MGSKPGHGIMRTIFRSSVYGAALFSHMPCACCIFWMVPECGRVDEWTKHGHTMVYGLFVGRTICTHPVRSYQFPKRSKAHGLEYERFWWNALHECDDEERSSGEPQVNIYPSQAAERHITVPDKMYETEIVAQCTAFTRRRDGTWS